jgi:hypothetical protein
LEEVSNQKRKKEGFVCFFFCLRIIPPNTPPRPSWAGAERNSVQSEPEKKGKKNL